MKPSGRPVSWIQSYSAPLLLRVKSSFLSGFLTLLSATYMCQMAILLVSGPSLNKTSGPTPAHRVILHFDLDCFYAQVEMIRNPALRQVPLGKLIYYNRFFMAGDVFLLKAQNAFVFLISSGIQQKYIIVTCNYVARGLGVTKMMSVTNAKEKCPQLVLVKGEDLTHYREMSYKVTGRQEQFIT